MMKIFGKKGYDYEENDDDLAEPDAHALVKSRV